MIKRFYILLLAIVASVGMSFAQDPGIVSSGTKGGMSYTFYDNGLLEISGSGALPGQAFTNWDGGFGTSVKNIRFAEDCEVYGLDYLWFGCYTENSQLEMVEINSVAPIMFSGTSGAGIFYRQDGAVTITITAPGIVDVENKIIDNYGSPVNMIFNMPATTVFEKKWFIGLTNNFAVTIPTGATGHIPAGYVFKDSYDQEEYDQLVADGYEDIFWDTHSNLVEGVDYTLGVESTFVITAENASQIFGKATVSFQAPTEASNSEWVLWRKSDLKEFPDMSSGDQKVCKDVTVKVNNGVYNTNSGFGLHFESLAEDGVQFVAPEGKVFKRIAILNGYGTFSDSNWSYGSNYKRWSGSADTVGFEGDICGISLIEFELGDSAPAAPAYETVMNLINEIPNPAVLTAECKEKIDAARTAYDALSDGDKDLVTNSATLTTAEAAFEDVMNIWLSGDCDVILWKDTTLTVRKHAGEGNGAMADYTSYYGDNTAPWFHSRWYNPQPGDIIIKSVTIEEGVTHLGDNAFGWMINLKTVTIPASVTSIGEDAFYWSKAVDDIYLSADPSNLTWVLPHSADNQFKAEKATRCHVPADLLTAYQEKFGTLNVTFVGDLDPITPLTPEQQQALDAAKGLINAIPSPVVYTPACKDAIDAARAAYDALTPDMLKQLVSNYATLTAAEATYESLKDVAVAEAKIAAIPQPVTLKLATRDSIESARAAYDALTADQKLLVSNYDVLTAAEATWAGLINVAPAGALSGKYTINDGGDFIYFAHGNLQYTRENLDADWSTGTFRLATNQYDLIELVKSSPNSYCTDNYGDKTAVGLFGWGTWGEGKTPNLTSSDRTLYTWSTDFSGTLEGTDTWRTLTKDEWVYLLTHNNQSYATVHGVNGLLVAPDGKDIEGKNMTDWVEINDETWTTMQNDGYLFLPACGQRSQLNSTANIITGGQGTEILYYSSTQYSDVYAHNIWYKPGQDPAADDYSNKRQAFGIRLVSAGVNPLDQVQVVKGLIEAIPAEITLDAACVNAIQSARAGYDALDTDAKAILDAADVKKLTDAEAALTALNQAEADKVVAKINAIPTPVELKLATRDSINNARAAYDALNAAQQALVTNYQTLLDAEAALAELNKGGSTPVDIVWDGNTGIANVSPTTTSPAYEGMTVTVGKGSSFSTYQSRLYFTFNSQPNGGFIFANENGTNITKVVIESTTALTSTMTEVDRMGSGWVISNENKTATWTGNADSVSIWKGEHFANYWVVDMITFTVNGTATPLDSAQIAKDLIDAIPTPVEYPTSGPAIAAALVAYKQLSDAAKGALDAADVQKMTDAAIQYAALDAIAAIEAIPAEIVYDPAVKAAIETAREKYDALIDASKALVDAEVVAKLTNAEQAWADLVALIEHTVTYIGKDGELKTEKVALLHIPDPAPELNGHEFVRWDVKAGDFLEEGLRIKAVYTPIITTQPVAYDTLVYNGTAQTLIEAGVASDGHIEYRLNEGAWSAELPKADMAAAYVVDYKLVREGHEDYMAGSVTAVIAKAPVTYVAPQAYDTLAYNYNTQVLVTAGQTNDGTIEYSLDPNLLDSWSADLPQAMNAGTYAVYFRVQGDLNHFDSIAPAPVAVTIAKRDIEVTAPVAYDTLVYNALAQTLAAAGSADFSTMEYTLTPDNGEGWSADMPQAMNAGTYAIYYRVQGDNNHNDYPAHSIAATIAQAPLTITAENKEVIYGDAAPEFTATYSGWMGQDDASVVSDLKISSDYAAGSSVGTYAIVPGEASALNYTITYVNGALVVTKAVVSVSGAEVQTAKFADGYTGAEVLNAGTLNGIKLNDPLTHVTTAVFSSAEVSEHLTITLFYELTGNAALLANYDLQPTSEVFTTEGVIIEPFLPNNTDDPEDKESKVQEGIEVYAYGYCEGDNVGLKYHLNSGNPDQYMIEFEDSRFADVDWTLLDEKGPEGVIYITVPVDVPTGDYKMTVYFRDSRFAWLESQPLNVTFHVNLPETYVRPLFDNTIVLVDTCECFTDIQWYHRADASEQWKPISGANGHYLHVEGKLTGEYFVKAKMNGVETYTCEQTDMQTLYGADTNKQAKVKAYPNPVVTTTTVSIENSDSYEHSLRIVNLMGIEVKNTTFEGNETVVDMDSYTTGNYTISVDGIVVKVLKQ